MKKIISLSVAVAIAFSAISGGFAADSSEGDFFGDGWSFSNGTLTVATNEGSTAWGVGRSPDTFLKTDVKTIVIENGVTSIGNYAFQGAGVTSVAIPDSVEVIGSQAFSSCMNLVSITIPVGVTKMETGVFRSCANLKKVTFKRATPPLIGNVLFQGGENPSRVIYVPFVSLSAYQSIAQLSVYEIIGFCDKCETPPNPCTCAPEGWDLTDGVLTVESDVGAEGWLFYKANLAADVVSVIIGESVTNITQSVFGGCTNLTSINVNSANTVYSSVDGALFNKNQTVILKYPPAKTDVGYIIADGVKSIGDNAFQGCENLSLLTFPQSVTSIGNNAFQGCENLALIIFPQSVASIGNNALGGCVNLTAVAFKSEKPPSIGSNIFLNADNSARVIYVPFGSMSAYRTNTQLNAYDIVWTCDKCVTPPNPCVCAPDGWNLTNGVLTVESDAGMEEWLLAKEFLAADVASVIIEDGVGVAANSFNGCTNLTSAEFKSVAPPSIGSKAFENTALSTVHIPAGSLNEYKLILAGFPPAKLTVISGSELSALFSGNGWFFLDGTLTITSGAGSTAWRAGRSAATFLPDDATEVTIERNVASIGERAFEDCRKLISLNVSPDNTYFTSVDGILFNKNQTEIIKYPQDKTGGGYIIPDGVTGVGHGAFRECKNLTSVIIPDGVTDIGSAAFYACSNLISIIIPDSVANIGGQEDYGQGVFAYCSSLNSVTIGKGVTMLPSQMFYYCSGLTSIIIPNNVTSMGENVFEHCTNLSSATLSDSLTSIGVAAFLWCENLISVTIPDGVTTISGNAFWSCKKLSSATIPNKVTSIEGYAFYDCPRITSITIPESVTNISGGAFRASGLTTVKFKSATPPVMNYYDIAMDNPFRETPLKTVYVPIGSKSAYQSVAVLSGRNIIEYCVVCDQVDCECKCEHCGESPCVCVLRIDVADGSIEIRNVTGKTVSARGLFLSDDDADLFKYPLPPFIIEPNGYILINENGETADILKRAQIDFDISAATKLSLTDCAGYTSERWNK